MRAIVAIFVLLIELGIFAAIIAGAWKVFAKAGQPGWGAIVPIYNTYLMTTQILGKPILWFILCFIPLVNIVIGILLAVELAKAFGKSTGFAVGLILLGPIFVPILGFGDATYQGAPKAA